MSNNTTETMTEQQRYQENIEKSANKKVEGIKKKKKERKAKNNCPWPTQGIT